MAFMALPAPSGPTLDEFGVFRIGQRAFLNATASGNTQVLPAQGVGIRIRVLAVFAVTNTAGLVLHFQSNTTRISSDKYPALTGGWVQPQAEIGWFQTAPNEALNLNLSGVGLVGLDIIWSQAG